MSALSGHVRTKGSPFRCVGCFCYRHACEKTTTMCRLEWAVTRQYPWPLVWPSEDEMTAPRFVYAIRDTLAGLVKIGVSNRPYTRLHQIQLEHGSWLELAAVKAGTIHDEARAHAQFHSARQLGEWFSETPAITTWINERRLVGRPARLAVA